MNNGPRRVVITGLGAVTPVGGTTDESWKSVLAGKSGFANDSYQVDISDMPIGGVCEVKDWDGAALVGRKEARRMDRCQQFSFVAAAEAMAQSGLEVTDDNRHRIGVYFGTGVGGVQTLIGTEHTLQSSGHRRVSPFAITMIMPNGSAGLLAIEYGLRGPAMTTTTACAAGSDGIGNGFLAVRMGLVDAAIVGGTEAPVTRVTMASFAKAGALSKRTEGTPSPFDKDRDGFVAAEGAGVLVIETLEHAQARGANILAEIVGFGQTCDAYHITAPDENGSGATLAIQNAIAMAGKTAADVDYMNAHGTGTRLNDSIETKAIKQALGEHAYNVAVSSTKSMTGHGMGATGAIETVFCTMALQDQIIPPTVSMVEADPECDLDYVTEGARKADLNLVTNHAFGFGGHNAVLALGKFTG
ncbi:MAG: beta-ketoacyl-ACP synthase II [Chloroflexota bacterium]